MIGRLNLFQCCSRLACIALPFVAFAIAYLVRFSGLVSFSETDYEPRLYFGFLILATIVWAITADAFHLSVTSNSVEQPSVWYRAAMAQATTCMFLLPLLFFYRVQLFSRIFLGISAGVLFAGSVALQVLISRASSGRSAVRVLVVGADEFAFQVATSLAAVRRPRCSVIGFVALEDDGRELAVDTPVFHICDLDGFVLGNVADEVVVAIPPARWHEIENMMPVLDRLGLPIRAALDHSGVIDGQQPVRWINTIGLATLALPKNT